MAELPIYCQSREMESRPSPSFPFDPPNKLVNSMLFLFARQKTDTPVRTGIIYSGKTSIVISLEIMKNNASHRLTFPKEKCRESDVEYSQLLLHLAFLPVQGLQK
jgi:hypothetical protein